MAEHGLHTLYDSSKDSPSQAVAELDIVAVHGLNFKNNRNHARETWMSGDCLWLKDLLPGKLNKPSRVMLFSYNSSPALNAAAITIDDHARALLQWLSIERKNAPHRPIIFICHSLGGLVVKATIHEANIDVTCKAISEATKLLVFFATPHRGGNHVNIGEVVANIVRASTRKPNNGLLDALKDSDTATMRFENSRHIYERCNVVNFVEGEPYRKLGIIVDKASATLNLPGSCEKQVVTHADHSSICKLESADSGLGRLVLGTIVQEIDRALKIECTLPTTKNVHWLVERSINPMFTGRRDVISKIKNAFASSRTDVQKRFVLTGMGGQGKSEVCLKVANELREQFWGVFWVDVSSESTAKSGLSNIAKLLGSTETGNDGVRLLLSNIDPNHPWLLVLDNADDPQVDYKQYCPSGTRGTILITSRNPECQNYATIGNEDLGSLDKEDCIDLLLQAARLTAQSLNVHSDAQKVIEILGSHTLAILQAGAYIAQGACDLSKYPSVFQKQSERLLRFNLTQDQSRYHDIYAALEASAEILESLQSERARDSLCLLQALSPLHYESVPLDIFKGAHNGAQFVQQTDRKYDSINYLTDEHVSHLPDFLQPHNDDWDWHRISKAVTLLESLALIKKDKIRDCSVISMHPLTHSWINLRQTEDESLRQSQCIIALSQYRQLDWQPYKYHVGVHVLSLLERSMEATDQGLCNFLLRVYVQIGWLLYGLQYDQKMEELLEYIFTELHIDPAHVTEEFEHIFIMRARVARCHEDTKQSIKILEQIVHLNLLKSRVDGVNFRHQHIIQCDLAHAYLKDWQTGRAIDLFQRTILIAETKLDKMDLITAKHQLGSAYLQNNQVEEAINQLEQVAQIYETFDKTHPERLTSQHELARAYLNDGQIHKAIDILEKIVQIRETTLDETHPHRLSSQHELARAYLEGGQIHKAINILEKIVQIDETTLDKTHPYRLSSQHELAIAYLNNGQIHKAIDILEQVIQIQETTLHKTHPNRLASRQELARAYLYNQQLEKAISMFEEVVRVGEETLEETNPNRLFSQHWLAKAYLDNGQVKQAIDLFECLVQIEERTLDETDPIRIETLEWLAYARSVDAENAAGIPPATPYVSAERPSSRKSKWRKMRHVIPSIIRALVGNCLSDK
ncbi:TPR-like protein [Annulohypoxylon nitens]|nr:TPR-like protein [Annulohypoxylon nitens]